MKKFLVLLLLIPNLSWSESIIYQCKFLKSDRASFEHPQTIVAIIDFSEKKLEKYIEDNLNLTNQYYCEACTSITNRVNVWKNGYNPFSLKKTDRENGRFFEIYASDLVGHLWKPINGAHYYQCQRF